MAISILRGSYWPNVSCWDFPYYACLFACVSKVSHWRKILAVLQQALALLPNRATLTQSGIAVHGPIDAPMAKKNSRFHSQLLLFSQQRSTLHTLLDNWWPMVQQLSIVKPLTRG